MELVCLEYVVLNSSPALSWHVIKVERLAGINSETADKRLKEMGDFRLLVEGSTFPAGDPVISKGETV